ncbi:hypothetical protein L0Y34_00890 [Candidatus Parcubacteria bacterium]|nr:hypothetical protein [Candidatus Parcubacteria bacterium]
MPDKEQTESPLERMRKRLYAPASVEDLSASPLSDGKQQKAEGWAPEPAPTPKVPGLSGSALFLLFAVGFFALAGLTAAVVLYLGGRSVSSDNLTITVEGPTTVSGGEDVSFLVTITNNNPLPATGATLELDFPEGTTEAEDVSVPLTNYTESLGDIAAGETLRRTVRAAFFGGENQRISIPIKVEYTTGNSNATFVKQEAHEFLISTAPVALSITTLSEIASGQPLTLVLTARSNAVAPLNNVAVIAEYPFGFTPTAETPEPSGNTFTLGTLAPGEEREMRIVGTLSGQDGEERVFRFSAGALKSSVSNEFNVTYSSKEAAVFITQPFLAVALTLGRSSDATIIASAGEPIQALLSWQNALNSVILDGRIEVRFSGDALDPTSVKATNGFFQSANRTVMFDRDTEAGLARLEPNDAGNGSFTFNTKTGSAGNALRNPSITLDVSVSGRRVGEASVPETVSSTIRRTIKIQSDLAVSAQAVRTVGPFENSGPWPPEANQETTYTIMLSAGNTVNSVGGATVSMTLPSYSRFTGVSEPAGEVSYNEFTREVTWAIGDMAAGSSREAAFQIAFLPSVSQKGTKPPLTSDVTIAGFDRFVQREIGQTVKAVDTQTSTDPAYQDSFSLVK